MTKHYACNPGVDFNKFEARYIWTIERSESREVDRVSAEIKIEG